MNVAESRLARRLDATDAVVLGLGSMLGAGIFAAVGPAAAVAGSGLLISVVIAGLIAFLNATAMAQLAARFPESGGTYIYGRKQLGNFWGFLAGWGFVIGKIASCTAMALTFSYYANPEYAKEIGIGTVVILTIINYLGIKKTAFVTKILVVLVMIVLGVVAFASIGGGGYDVNRLSGLMDRGGFYGIMQASGLMFFAFAGYARIATLGEEVINPQKTIPKSIMVALGIVLCVYLIIAGSAVLTVDIDRLANSTSPLVDAVRSGYFSYLSPVVRWGACFASLSVLLSLMAGISRTVFSMSSNSDLPKFLSAVHPRHKVPYLAELLVGAIISVIVGFSDLRGAIGFSSFSILIYYTISNIAAYKLAGKDRLWPRWMAVCGALTCLVVALMLPTKSILGGIVVFLIGAAVFLVKHRIRRFIF